MNYRLTVLTPLLVGDGQKLAPIDYMVWKDQVNVLDQNRIFRLLAKGPRLEGYLTQLRKAEKLDFASWGGFAQNYAERRIPFEHASMTPVWNDTRAEHLFIPTFATGTDGAYLPASALKGALRTGLAFSRWNDGVVREIAGRMEGERALRRPGEAAESMTLGQGGNDPMRNVLIADSKPVANTAFKIYLVRVSALQAKGDIGWKPSPPFAEMAIPGTEFTGGLTARKDLLPLLEASNEHAASLLGMHRRYAEQAKLPRLQSTIAGLEARLTDIRGRKDACLLNMGWAGGFLSKAAFLDTASEDYRRLLGRLPYYERAIRTGMPFPKTRRIIFEQNQPALLAGWALLEVQ